MAIRSPRLPIPAALCLLSLLCPNLRADDAPTASTPQGALLLFIRALESGDADRAIAACILRDEDDKAMLAAVASATKAHADLRKALKAKWPDDAPGPEVQIKGFTRIFTEWDFTDPTLTEDGDSTKAELREKRGTLFLTKQNDTWKISLEACMKDYSGYKPAAVIETFKECEDKATKLTERLAAGEFESFAALQDDIEKADREAENQRRNRKKAGL